MLLAAFVLNETRAPQPITPLRLFAERGPLRLVRRRGCCWWAGMFGMFFFLTQFLQDVLGFSPLTAGHRVPADDRCCCSRSPGSRRG